MLKTERIAKTKSHEAYKTISEVAKILEITTSTIRFWEKEFKQIKPYVINKRRYYSQTNITIITKIKELLYQKGYTLTGAKKYFKSLKDITAKEKDPQLQLRIKKIIELLTLAKNELDKQ